jgi:hypothetical protein
MRSPDQPSRTGHSDPVQSILHFSLPNTKPGSRLTRASMVISVRPSQELEAAASIIALNGP